MSIDKLVTGALYRGKTVKDVYCGWKNEHSIENARYLSEKVEEFLNNKVLETDLSIVRTMLDTCSITVEGDRLFINSFFYKYGNFLEELTLLSTNRKWYNDILTYAGNFKFSTKRQWYPRSSEFTIGDGDPFYIKYLSELEEDSSKLFLTDQEKLELESLTIFKVRDYFFELIETIVKDDETMMQTYVFKPNIEYLTFDNFFLKMGTG